MCESKNQTIFFFIIFYLFVTVIIIINIMEYVKNIKKLYLKNEKTN